MLPVKNRIIPLSGVSVQVKILDANLFSSHFSHFPIHFQKIQATFQFYEPLSSIFKQLVEKSLRRPRCEALLPNRQPRKAPPPHNPAKPKKDQPPKRLAPHQILVISILPICRTRCLLLRFVVFILLCSAVFFRFLCHAESLLFH